MLLLAVGFVCRVGHPEEFRYLENDEHPPKIGRFDREDLSWLVATSHQSGFYLAYARCGKMGNRHPLPILPRSNRIWRR